MGSALLAQAGDARTKEIPAKEIVPLAVRTALASPSPGPQVALLLAPRLAEDPSRRYAAARELDRLVATFVIRAADSALASNQRLYRHLLPWFERYSFDCNERVVLHFDATRRLGLPLPEYARTLDHAGLLFEQEGLVLDPYDGTLRTLLDFARASYHRDRGEGYFLRTPTAHYLVVVDAGGTRLLALTAAERPDPVAPQEPLVSLLLDVAANAESPETARAWVELALELEPGSADAHDILGGLSPDLAAAAAQYAVALGLDPHAARAHYNLGVNLQLRRQAVAAESEYRAALALQPTLLVAVENLGAMLLVVPGRREEGVALLTESLDREPSPQLRRQIRELLAGIPARPSAAPGAIERDPE